MRTALRTAVATALLAGVVVTPALTAGTAFAADGPTVTADKPAAKPAAKTPIRTVALDGGLTAQVFAEGDKDPYYTATVLKGAKELGTLTAGAGRAAKETKVFAGYAVTLDSTGAVTSVQDQGGGGQGPETPVGDKIGTHKLADGTVGELWRKAKGHYTLELKTAAGKPRGSVTAGGPGGKAEKGDQFGEMWVTLDNKGRVGSWLNRNLGTDYADTTKGCTVTRNSGSGFDELSLQLVNSPSGAFARILHDDEGKVLATLTLTKSTALADGVWLSTMPGAKKPFVQMRTSEPEVLFTLDFPDLPKGCEDGTPGTTPTTPAPAPSKPAGTSGQTTVVPQGGVAAGAELGSVENANDTALMASGLGAASVVAAGLGFTVLRRRAAARG
ncbi:hypothetical protein [Streptomyces sp. NPDC058579]|uniref:hypothetical protein n=1 Tax=Streptomyces sp. NPDC058579 TaxID=3346548 RepID=UPI00365F8223